MNEFVIEWLRGQTVATVTAPSGSRLKGRMMKLLEQYPDEVDVHENRDGSICGHVPVSYIKVSHPRKISEEQKKASGERFREMWNQKKAEEDSLMWDDSDEWEDEDEV